MSVSSLAAAVPPNWASAVRPFLQRADEFQAREPLVSYFLRTHVAFVCMQKRTKEDKEGTKFLMKLLDALEGEKKTLGNKLDGEDGRTVLTKYALMLFARADDEERSGKASMALVRLFYTSAVLFEATAQFTDDGHMDAVAAEKCKYAKYIATRMKKALDGGEAYVSPNKIEAPLSGETEDGEGTVGPVLTTAPPSSYMQRPSQPPQPPQPQPSPQPPADNSWQKTHSSNDAPPPYAPPTTMNNHKNHSNNAASVPQRQQPPPQLPQPQQPHPSAVRPAVAPAPPPPAAATDCTPSPDDMIDAQKFARQAVSALQFYDHKSARTQLISALNILDGRKQ